MTPTPNTPIDNEDFAGEPLDAPKPYEFWEQKPAPAPSN